MGATKDGSRKVLCLFLPVFIPARVRLNNGGSAAGRPPNREPVEMGTERNIITLVGDAAHPVAQYSSPGRLAWRRWSRFRHAGAKALERAAATRSEHCAGHESVRRRRIPHGVSSTTRTEMGRLYLAYPAPGL